MADQYETQLNVLDKSVDDYINQLISQSQGDRDFIIKQLEANYDLALGTDDNARADFLEKVADKLEERIGTIAFDFERGVERTTEDKNEALRRLDEDDRILKENLERQSIEARQNRVKL